MKARPILFKGPMVRALLDGSKTQTRRVVKPQPVYDGRFAGGWKIVGKAGHEAATCSPLVAELSPHGQPGDRLWVKETFAPALDFGRATEHFFYRATYTNGGPYDDVKIWKPSIHMPRSASRITLEITDVRVERLQDISEADARAEGITDGGCTNCGESEAKCKCDSPMPDARDSYCRLWGQINGPDSWINNPWVWVVEFKRVAAA